MLYLEKFIKEHSNWEELLTKKPYGLHLMRDSGYIIFKYDMIESDFTLPEVKEARGIIFRESDWKCVCHPFNKFHNAEESCSSLKEMDWPSSSVQEKIDGSLMKVWYDNGWHVSTNGTIDAYKAEMSNGILMKYKTFGDLFEGALKVSYNMTVKDLTDMLDKEYTYMFELISPYNRVVIEYPKEDLYLLGCRHIISQQEKDLAGTELNKIFKMPQRYNLHCYDDVKKAAEALDWTKEGYVACDKDFRRVKIKSPSYVKAHYIRNNNSVTYERLMDIILSGEEEEFIVYASDYKDILYKVKEAYENMIKEIKQTIVELKPETYPDRKSYAQVVLQKPRWMQVFLFNYQKVDETIKDIKDWKWIEFMKQRGDIK